VAQRMVNQSVYLYIAALEVNVLNCRESSTVGRMMAGSVFVSWDGQGWHLVRAVAGRL
jgi:hypothetical protein